MGFRAGDVGSDRGLAAFPAKNFPFAFAAPFLEAGSPDTTTDLCHVSIHYPNKGCSFNLYLSFAASAAASLSCRASMSESKLDDETLLGCADLD